MKYEPREEPKTAELRRTTLQRWLLRQAKRNDPVGDLARDLRQDLKGRREETDLPLPGDGAND